MGSYDMAQVCPNGHTATSSYGMHPEFRREYCEKCGEKTITFCPKCSKAIRGEYHVRGVFRIHCQYFPPAFCHHCGNAFPWTERKMAAAFQIFAEESNLNKEDGKMLEQSIKEIVRDTPQTQVAANRFKRMLAKVGSSAAGAVKDVLVDIVSEVAKKIIWPEK